MGHDANPHANEDERPRPSTTQTVAAKRPSAVETMTAAPEALANLFQAPAAPGAPVNRTLARTPAPSATATLPARAPSLGAPAPVAHPADTNLDTQPRPSVVETLAQPRPSVTETISAPSPRPSVTETISAPPSRPSVTETISAPPSRPSVTETISAPADEPPSSPRETVDGTIFRGSTAGAPDPEGSAAVIAAAARPDAPESLDRNLALARLQEKMLGVQAETVKIGRFVVIRKLGQGAMGIVYLAYDPKLDRKVAIKLVDTSALGSEVGDAQIRLEREAKAAAALGHPNVVTVYDVGNHDDDVFLAMEYVEGTSLTDWMKEEHDWRTVVTLFGEIAHGLSAAHEAGLVHRDFKPDNVLMGNDGRPRVADFGLARPTEGWSARDAAKMLGDGSDVAASAKVLAVRSANALASTGEVCGTPAYMAPEQFAGIDVDAGSDQFGFCATLFEALFGYRPFKGDSVTELAVAVIENDRQPLPEQHGVPKAVVEAVLKGLEPEAANRHASMTALANRLDDVLRARTRNRVLAGGALVTVLGIGFGAQAADALTEKPCDAAATDIDDTWSSPQRADVVSRLEERSLPSDVVDTLDDFAQRWTSIRTEACEATRVEGVQAEDVMQLRIACLDQAEARLHLTATALSTEPTEDVVRAVPVALGELETCNNVQVLTENDASLETGAEKDFDRQVAFAKANEAIARLRLYAHKSPEVWKADAEFLVDIGESSDMSHAAAMGHLYMGAADSREGRLKDAATHYDAALPYATRGLSNRLLLEVLLGSAEIAERLGDIPTARSSIKLADAYLGTIRDREAAQIVSAQVTLTAAAVHARADDPAKALEQLQKLDADGLRKAERERMHSTWGKACRQQGDTECAIEHHTRSYELARTLPDIDPIDLAGRVANVGVMQMDQGNLPAAAERWQTAADIVKEAAGPDHPMRGSLLSDLGGLTALGLENPDEGEPLMLEGLAILEKTHGPKAPELVEVLMDLAKTKLMLGDPAAAEPYATRALAIVDEAFEGKHPRRADPRMPMADIFAATGRFEQAQALLNEALEILDDPKTHPMQRADVQFALARALAPTDADAAGAMADAAIAGIADFEPGKPLRDAIEGWRGAVLNGGEHPPT